MAKEESSKSGGLLSKVVRFVRHPTVNWSDLDGLDGEQESQYSKQALKEMIERKRRNDFVRKREFDQLRRLRQAELQQASRPGTAPVGVPGPAAQGSQFLSSLLSSKSSGERAVTLKKIDEIEAQMSQQWWRGKQAADATTIPMALPAGGNPRPGLVSQAAAAVWADSHAQRRGAAGHCLGRRRGGLCHHPTHEPGACAAGALRLDGSHH